MVAPWVVVLMATMPGVRAGVPSDLPNPNPCCWLGIRGGLGVPLPEQGPAVLSVRGFQSIG